MSPNYFDYDEAHNIDSVSDSEKAAIALIEQIDDMLSGDEYRWAEDTLLGIRETVEKTRRVTERQRRAVENIEDARGGRQ